MSTLPENYERFQKNELWNSYLATDYVVSDGEVHFEIGIGSKNRELAEFLATNTLTKWAFLTAYNPYSIELTDEDNQRPQRILFDRLREAGYSFLHGYGKSRYQDWPPEPSVLVLGISPEKAVELGRAFQQNAIVTGSSDKPAELVWCQKSIKD
ncbi:MAG: DUF3293 domain-containing protein [Pyrinomonadaceae bacterium]